MRRGWAVVLLASWSVAASGQQEDPLPVAQGHLRRAREYSKASAQMLEKCDRHAVDGFYVACEEAWNAVWTCPGSPEILGEAAEIYAAALGGLLESGRDRKSNV